MKIYVHISIVIEYSRLYKYSYVYIIFEEIIQQECDRIDSKFVNQICEIY